MLFLKVTKQVSGPHKTAKITILSNLIYIFDPLQNTFTDLYTEAGCGTMTPQN
jgi:hypothetical protein